MVKVNTICRNPKEYEKKSIKDVTKMHRNPDPSLNPFQEAREYQRALNAAKVEKIFSKPFIAALDTHADGITCVSKNINSMVDFVTGSHDGVIVMWNLHSKSVQHEISAHKNSIRGLCYANPASVNLTDTMFLSTGDDKYVNIWSLNNCEKQKKNVTKRGEKAAYTPKAQYISKSLLFNVDHSYDEPKFATSGAIVQVWDYERSDPISKFDWGMDSVHKLKWNPSETNLILASASDRSVCLYDIRGNTPLKRLFLKNKSSAICWNPYEPINFVVGNEDSNCYTFDMRKLDEAKMIHKDHTNAILDIDFSPTGKEFATGSFDKTIRIFKYNSGRSREVYHTKRMQQVNAICYSMDSKFIISGSEDTNVRIWKSNASYSLKPMLPREKEQIAYANRLKKKFGFNKEIKRILRHKHVPKLIKKRHNIRHVQTESRNRKDKNIRENSKPGALPYVPERKKEEEDGAN
jgi:WD repeat and SOF domain-containing protein 1